MLPVEQNKSGSNFLADPLVYIISFVILFLITLIILTWVLKMYYDSHSCVYYANIWCSDNWRCHNTCNGTTDENNVTDNEGRPVNVCFASDGPAKGPTGLASCLYGPTSRAATICMGPAENNLTCDCQEPMETTESCFSGCASSISDINSNLGQICCCTDVNNPACAATPDSCPLN